MMLAMSRSGELTSDYNATKEGLATTVEAGIPTAEDESEDESSFCKQEASEFFGTLFHEEFKNVSRKEAGAFIPGETDAAAPLELGEDKENEAPASDTMLGDIDHIKKPISTNVSLSCSAVLKQEATRAPVETSSQSISPSASGSKNVKSTSRSKSKPLSKTALSKKLRREEKDEKSRLHDSSTKVLAWTWQARQALLALQRDSTDANAPRLPVGHYHPRRELGEDSEDEGFLVG